MLARGVLLAIAVVLVAVGCGGNSNRDAVAKYLTLVDSTENGLAAPLRAVSTANEGFAKQHETPKVEAQLQQAEQTLQSLQRKLAGITPPPEAKHLHSLLLELVGREVGLTHEVYALSVFLPRFDAELQPLAKADRSLKAELGQSAKGAAAAKALDADKARALTAYVAVVDGVSAQLRLLHPPAVWRPVYEGQLSTLTQLHTSGTALAQAIAGNRAAAVPALLRQFDAAAVAGQSVAAQRRQIAAVDAYDRRVNSLTTLARQIERERNRLQRVTS